MNVELLQNAKTKVDLLNFLRSANASKFKDIAINKVRSQSFNDALQTTWNFYLQQDGKYFLGKEVTKTCWHKGTAIGGMECHSSGH